MLQVSDRYLLYLGPAGSGRTEMLRRRYRELTQDHVPTDRILVLTASSGQASEWRHKMDLKAHGPLRIWSYFGFVQEELRIHFGAIQEAVPELRRFTAPEFATVETSHHIMRGLVEERAPAFAEVAASPQRIAIQIASNINTVAAASGVPLHEIGPRLEAASRRDRYAVYTAVQEVLEAYRRITLESGVLDYGTSLELFRSVLLRSPLYGSSLQRRYRHLLVDDLDESSPAQQEFMAVAAPLLDSCAFAFNLDGGHSVFMGAQPTLAMQRFRPDSSVAELERSHTCSEKMFSFGDGLYRRIMGGVRPSRRFEDVVQEQIRTDLRGEMIKEVAQAIGRLIGRGVSPGQIAVISPHIDRALEVAVRRTVPGGKVQNLSLSRRLLDERAARAVITLASLAHPQWAVSLGRGAVADALRVLLELDPIRASVLADQVIRAGALPALDDTDLRRRVGFERSEAYDRLKTWIEERSGREHEIDEFCQAVFGELLAPLRPERETVHSTQQLLFSAHRFRRAMERVRPDEVHGSGYLTMLLEGTVAADPLESYLHDEGALVLATPFAYLSGHLTSQYQVWVDVASDAWFPNDVKELANPIVLSPQWQKGDVWTDSMANRRRQENGARTVRALARRCTGRLLLAESQLSAWGVEQEGGLSNALADLIVITAGRFGKGVGGA